MTLATSAWAKRTSTHHPPPNRRHDHTNAHDPSDNTPPSPSKAPSAPRPIGQSNDIQTLHRLTTRLHWKAETLLLSLQRAVDVEPHVASAESLWVESRCRSAMTMFKLDFYEFYTLLERAVVLALALCGVRVLRSVAAAPLTEESSSNGQTSDANAHGGPHVGARTGGNQANGHDTTSDEKQEFIFQTQGRRAIVPSRPSLSSTTITPSPTVTNSASPDVNTTTSRPNPGTHRFHANLLSTLALSTNPLYPALGTGPGYTALQRAKTLRNQWKDADANTASSRSSSGIPTQSPAMDEIGPDLLAMLQALLTGIDHAAAIVETSHSGLSGDRAGGQGLDMAGVAGTARGLMDQIVEVEMVDAPSEYGENGGPGGAGEGWCEVLEDGMEWE